MGIVAEGRRPWSTALPPTMPSFERDSTPEPTYPNSAVIRQEARTLCTTMSERRPQRRLEVQSVEPLQLAPQLPSAGLNYSALASKEPLPSLEDMLPSQLEDACRPATKEWPQSEQPRWDRTPLESVHNPL